jgi:hypothetical protein
MSRRAPLTTVVAVVALVAIVGSSPMLAEDCKFHKFRAKFELMDQPLADYDACYFNKLRGTINGQMISCYYGADFIPSDFLWTDGNYDYWAGKGDDFVETSKGDILMEERAIFDLEEELATGQAVVTGGTGAYENASGVLQFYNRYPNRLDLFVYEGWICTP